MTSTGSMAQSAAMIAIFTLISKFLGFLREVLIASKFGSGMETDTYFVAMTATVIIMGTLGGALNTTLIPILAKVSPHMGPKKINRAIPLTKGGKIIGISTKVSKTTLPGIS